MVRSHEGSHVAARSRQINSGAEAKLTRRRYECHSDLIISEFLHSPYAATGEHPNLLAVGGWPSREWPPRPQLRWRGNRPRTTHCQENQPNVSTLPSLLSAKIDSVMNDMVQATNVVNVIDVRGSSMTNQILKRHRVQPVARHHLCEPGDWSIDACETGSHRALAARPTSGS